MVQLRALARAAVHGNVKVMVPMVTLPDELAQCRAHARAGGAARFSPAACRRKLPPLGMMVEVPAAALAIDAFDADFYSIGSNDLLQYLMAASRDEPELAALASPGPAFWRVLREMAAHGRAAQREVSLCGDLASDTRHVPELLRMWLADTVGRARVSGCGKGCRAPELMRMAPRSPAKSEAPQERVGAYKRVLQEVLESRPSGMRQRLAEALEKNRSFISLISNPAYPTPIPVQHVERIFEICHFSPRERERFLVAYRAAHPRRLQVLKEEHERLRQVTSRSAGSGHEARNRQLDAIVKEFAEKVARLLREP